VPNDFFEMEAEGLRLLKSAGSGLRIPEVIAAERPSGNRPAFLLMEFIETGRSGDSFAFGEKLADLHKNGADLFGLDHTNYIGSLPQSNRQHDKWSDFFHEERILPQLKMAVDSGKMNNTAITQWNNLAKRLDDLLPFVKPSLIHGDLWGGNYLFDATGNAVLIDPAVYYGHPEMDLAFSKMFGGFSANFYEGYQSIAPLEPGFGDRVPIHNLYPLLVHVNLFGGHYVSQAKGVLGRF
jgi:protein-ribulosamine 3-kinase